jgi:rhodanese-related sulfurtransferase
MAMEGSTRIGFGGTVMRMENAKRNTALALFVLALFIVILPAHPVLSSDASRISIDELKAMIDKGSPVTIVDVQPKAIYDAGHVKGAISLPFKSQLQLEDVWSLPQDRLIVVYCDCGPGEADSSDMADQFIKFGYENVKVLKDPSIKGWRAAGYPMEKKK